MRLHHGGLRHARLPLALSRAEMATPCSCYDTCKGAGEGRSKNAALMTFLNDVKMVVSLGSHKAVAISNLALMFNSVRITEEIVYNTVLEMWLMANKVYIFENSLFQNSLFFKTQKSLFNQIRSLHLTFIIRKNKLCKSLRSEYK